jgi:hypothetical protein
MGANVSSNLAPLLTIQSSGAADPWAIAAASLSGSTAGADALPFRQPSPTAGNAYLVTLEMDNAAAEP